MKKIILMLALVTTILHLSCKKEVNEGPGEVYGNWILTAKQSQPGDGSIGGYYRVVSNLTITLTTSGLIEGTAFPNFRSFKILDKNQIEIYTESSTIPLLYFYNVTDKSLSLGSVSCDEGCYVKFTRR